MPLQPLIGRAAVERLADGGLLVLARPRSHPTRCRISPDRAEGGPGRLNRPTPPSRWLGRSTEAAQRLHLAVRGAGCHVDPATR